MQTMIWKDGKYEVHADTSPKIGMVWVQLEGVDKRGVGCALFLTDPEPLLPAHKAAGATEDTHFRLGPAMFRRGALDAIQQAGAEWSANIAANRPENRLPGLQEIQACLSAHEDYAEAFERMMEDENATGASLPAKPVDGELVRLQAEYPDAAAYNIAIRKSTAAHWSSPKSSIYRQAADDILAGCEDAAARLAEADTKWQEAAEAAVLRS